MKKIALIMDGWKLILHICMARRSVGAYQRDE